jgi:hypothetical protein
VGSIPTGPAIDRKPIMFTVSDKAQLAELSFRFPVLVKTEYKAGAGLEQEVGDEDTLYAVAESIFPQKVLIFQAPKTLGALLAVLSQDTANHSSMRMRTEHPNFPKIVAYGDLATRYLLVKMAADQIHWEYFALLRELTGTNPVKLEHRGFIDFMASDWLQWARDNGKLDPLGEELMNQHRSDVQQRNALV